MAIRVVRRLTDEGPVFALPRMIYSQGPRLARDMDGDLWVTKGPDPMIVAAELLGYALAALTGLLTPDPAAVVVSASDNTRLAGSRMVDQRADPVTLIESGLARNPTLLAECLAFDIWTCNDDRNQGNILARSTGGQGEAEAELLAIDFESAKLLRGESVLVLTRPPTSYLPKPALRGHLAMLPPAHLLCARIAALREVDIRKAVTDVEVAMDRPLPEADRIVQGLHSRAPSVTSLVAEAMSHV